MTIENHHAILVQYWYIFTEIALICHLKKHILKPLTYNTCKIYWDNNVFYYKFDIILLSLSEYVLLHCLTWERGEVYILYILEITVVKLQYIQRFLSKLDQIKQRYNLIWENTVAVTLCLLNVFNGFSGGKANTLKLGWICSQKRLHCKSSKFQYKKFVLTMPIWIHFWWVISILRNEYQVQLYWSKVLRYKLNTIASYFEEHKLKAYRSCSKKCPNIF